MQLEKFEEVENFLKNQIKFLNAKIGKKNNTAVNLTFSKIVDTLSNYDQLCYLLYNHNFLAKYIKNIELGFC